MDAMLQQALLYDFYGDMLTDHQRSVYEAVVQEDLSYSEAADLFGVSRQGVHEIVKRCERLLSQYEEKLHLVDRFLKIRGNVKQIQDLAAEIEESDQDERAAMIAKLAEQILEEV